ncbi:MAG: hypothetical protein LQ344_005134 [Seirophora lacunosa]|nr:MAG: hypothetical protein LQ344_005134 [Seirophora lacunosa]
MTPNAPKDLRTALGCNASHQHWQASLDCLQEWQESDIPFEEYQWDDKMDVQARTCVDLFFPGPGETEEKQTERASAFRDDVLRRLRRLKEAHGVHWITQNLAAIHRANQQARTPATTFFPRGTLLVILFVIFLSALVPKMFEHHASSTGRAPSESLSQPILADFAPATMSVLTLAASQAAESSTFSPAARQRILTAARNVQAESARVHSASQTYLHHIEECISNALHTTRAVDRHNILAAALRTSSSPPDPWSHAAYHPPEPLQSSLIRLETEIPTLLRLVSHTDGPAAHHVTGPLDRLLRAVRHYRSFIARVQGLSGTEDGADEEDGPSVVQARMLELVEEWVRLVRSDGDDPTGL